MLKLEPKASQGWIGFVRPPQVYTGWKRYEVQKDTHTTKIVPHSLSDKSKQRRITIGCHTVNCFLWQQNEIHCSGNFFFKAFLIRIYAINPNVVLFNRLNSFQLVFSLLYKYKSLQYEWHWPSLVMRFNRTFFKLFPIGRCYSGSENPIAYTETVGSLCKTQTAT